MSRVVCPVSGAALQESVMKHFISGRPILPILRRLRTVILGLLLVFAGSERLDGSSAPVLAGDDTKIGTGGG